MERNTTIILSLIKQDLTCNKLVLGLSELGLEAGKYHLDIGTIVLNLMGFPDPGDDLLDMYFKFMDKAIEIKDVEEESGRLEMMALELYNELQAEKKRRDQQTTGG
jgi:hypothetical protein